MSYVPSDVKERIRRVAWFEHCGEPAYFTGCPFEVMRVANWIEAQRYYTDVAWVVADTRSANALRLHVQRVREERYHDWNKIAREARAFAKDEIAPVLREVISRRGIDERVAREVCSDVVAICVEAGYLDLKPPLFAMKLLEVYEAGHFPCGWIGVWPEGELVVL